MITAGWLSNQRLIVYIFLFLFTFPIFYSKVGHLKYLATTLDSAFLPLVGRGGYCLLRNLPVLNLSLHGGVAGDSSAGF